MEELRVEWITGEDGLVEMNLIACRRVMGVYGYH
jgi:hypothetical protein